MSDRYRRDLTDEEYAKQQHTDAEIAECVADIKSEILLDIANGVQPYDVGSFSDLHDHVDANTYGGLCGDDSRADFTLGDVIAVQDRVDAWLRRRRSIIDERKGRKT